MRTKSIFDFQRATTAHCACTSHIKKQAKADFSILE